MSEPVKTLEELAQRIAKREPNFYDLALRFRPMTADEISVTKSAARVPLHEVARYLASVKHPCSWDISEERYKRIFQMTLALKNPGQFTASALNDAEIFFQKKKKRFFSLRQKDLA
jgi:hypothetical protein